MILESNDTLTLNLTPQEEMSLNTEVPRIINGTSDYEQLQNIPQIESVKLIGNKTFPELGISPISADDLIEVLN